MHGEAERTDDSITIIERIVHDDLARFYDKEFEVVARHVRAFLNDEEYVQIYIVFDGRLEELRATNWAKGLTGRIRGKLSSEQIEEFPILSPVSKSEWPMIKRALPSEQQADDYLKLGWETISSTPGRPLRSLPCSGARAQAPDHVPCRQRKRSPLQVSLPPLRPRHRTPSFSIAFRETDGIRMRFHETPSESAISSMIRCAASRGRG